MKTLNLSERQQQILKYIEKCVRDQGYPPSVREIGEAVGLTSSSTVHSHLNKLETLGYIRRDPQKFRALEVLGHFNAQSGMVATGLRQISPQIHSDDSNNSFRPAISIPLVGTVTAGQPILAEQNIEDYLPFPADFVKDESSFLLKVSGDSMIEAGILDGDMVIVREQKNANNGDIVVALVNDDSATVKVFYKEANRIRLQPRNSALQPIYADNIVILGKVIGLYRKFN